jgi:hypothetical protein
MPGPARFCLMDLVGHMLAGSLCAPARHRNAVVPHRFAGPFPGLHLLDVPGFSTAVPERDVGYLVQENVEASPCSRVGRLYLTLLDECSPAKP